MSGPRKFKIRSANADVEDMYWRGFGDYKDLQVDFQNPDRVELVVQLLQNCRLVSPTQPDRTQQYMQQHTQQHTQQQDSESIWRLTLSGRIGALVAVYILTFNQTELEMLHVCSASSCAKTFTTSLPLERLLDMARQAEQDPELDIKLEKGHTIRIRRPTGLEQKQWQSQRYRSESEATNYMLSTLVQDDETISSSQWRILMDALEDQDPLVSFRLINHCPYCDHAMLIPVDLEALMLNELKKAQYKLHHDVHVIASQYGWVEEDILSIPATRRQQYIELIKSEGMA